MDKADLTKLLEDLTDALSNSSTKEVMLSEAVERWLIQAQDQSLTEGVRETYLECAQTVTAIYA